jgi:hypothetical protein
MTQKVVHTCNAITVVYYMSLLLLLLLEFCLCRWLWFEVAAGAVVARLAVNDQLVVMHRPKQQ